MTDFMQTTGIGLLAINAIALTYVVRDLQRRFLKGQLRKRHVTTNEVTFGSEALSSGKQSKRISLDGASDVLVKSGSTLDEKYFVSIVE